VHPRKAYGTLCHEQSSGLLHTHGLDESTFQIERLGLYNGLGGRVVDTLGVCDGLNNLRRSDRCCDIQGC
jgi:hypothetical protein